MRIEFNRTEINLARDVETALRKNFKDKRNEQLLVDTATRAATTMRSLAAITVCLRLINNYHHDRADTPTEGKCGIRLVPDWSAEKIKQGTSRRMLEAVTNKSTKVTPVLSDLNSPTSHRNRNGPVEFNADIESAPGVEDSHEYAGGTRCRL